MSEGEAERRIFADAEALARAAAEFLCDRARAGGNPFRVCLSGGSTPRRLYQLLAEPEFSGRFPWPRVHLFWGDERFVPPDSPDSNYRMVREALLERAPVPPGNIHPVPTDEGDVEQVAQAYEQILKTQYGADHPDPRRPLFDLTLLGLGEDGHTASLFPGDPVLNERVRWAAGVRGEKPPPLRVTLTYPALNSSRTVLFLVTGEGKRDALARIFAGDRSLPAARVNPVGRLVWFADRAACPEGTEM
jgi:6-phosphogluconolactonase